jgi:hypothetical protein
LGYLEAILAVLHGFVGSISFDTDAARGRVTMRSTGGPIAYQFSWTVEPGRVVFGGFGHSEGQPTYQVAIVTLAQLVALHHCVATAQTSEIIAQWYALIDAMEAAEPRANQDAGWDKRTIAGACATPTIRAHIERMSGALNHAMRFHLPLLAPGDSIPPLSERGLVVTAPDVLSVGDGRTHTLPGAVLLQPGGMPGRAGMPVPAGTTTGSLPETGGSDATTIVPERATRPARPARRRTKASPSESPSVVPAGSAATPAPATSAPPSGAPVPTPTPTPTSVAGSTDRAERLLSACLLHRWDVLRPKKMATRIAFPHAADRAVWEERVRSLVERAWQVTDTEEVAGIASQILKLLGIPERANVPRGLSNPVDNGTAGERAVDDPPLTVAGVSVALRTTTEDQPVEEDRIEGADPPGIDVDLTGRQLML